MDKGVADPVLQSIIESRETNDIFTFYIPRRFFPALNKETMLLTTATACFLVNTVGGHIH